jgi:16S rRNA U516 pseudouridylate synthase RsuA-like enzyme
MVGSFSHQVTQLTRVRFGNIGLEGLEVGGAALLSVEEVRSLLGC